MSLIPISYHGRDLKLIDFDKDKLALSIYITPPDDFVAVVQWKTPEDALWFYQSHLDDLCTHWRYEPIVTKDDVIIGFGPTIVLDTNVSITDKHLDKYRQIVLPKYCIDDDNLVVSKRFDRHAKLVDTKYLSGANARIRIPYLSGDPYAQVLGKPGPATGIKFQNGTFETFSHVEGISYSDFISRSRKGKHEHNRSSLH